MECKGVSRGRVLGWMVVRRGLTRRQSRTGSPSAAQQTPVYTCALPMCPGVLPNLCPPPVLPGVDGPEGAEVLPDAGQGLPAHHCSLLPAPWQSPDGHVCQAERSQGHSHLACLALGQARQGDLKVGCSGKLPGNVAM